MAHSGQERALRLVRPFGCGARLLRLLEQPCVLDGDHRLVAEGIEQRQLLIGQRPRRLAQYADRTDAAPLPHHRRPRDRAIADLLHDGTHRPRQVGRGQSIGQVNGAALANDHRIHRLIEGLRKRRGDGFQRLAAPRADVNLTIVAEKEDA